MSEDDETVEILPELTDEDDPSCGLKTEDSQTRFLHPDTSRE